MFDEKNVERAKQDLLPPCDGDKNYPMHEFFCNHTGDRFSIGFKELGLTRGDGILPPSAYRMRSWWKFRSEHDDRDGKRRNRATLAWLTAGWGIDYLSLEEKQVVFVKFKNLKTNTPATSPTNKTSHSKTSHSNVGGHIVAGVVVMVAVSLAPAVIRQIGKFGGKQVVKEIGTQATEQAVKQTGKESGGLTTGEIVGKEIAKAGVKIGARQINTSTGTATYSGEMEFNIDSNSTKLFPDISYIGDLSMEFDFEEMTFEGTAVLTRYDSSLQEFVSIGTVTLDSTPIGDNKFEGTFILDEAVRADIGLTGNPVGNYVGNFIASDKDNITGLMGMSGTNANGSVIGIGSFGADRQ